MASPSKKTDDATTNKNKKSKSASSSSQSSTATATPTKFADNVDAFKFILLAAWTLFAGQAFIRIVTEAYTIRLHAINEFGRIIHEFDPYFNYRATEYLYEHGWNAFKSWFDYLVWYPLGRPVGTTIYPGMQVTAVFIKNWIVGDNMSLNDVCCLIPAWFGAVASVMTGLMAYEACVGSYRPKFGFAAAAAASSSTTTVPEPKPSDPQVYCSILSTVPIINVLYERVVSPLVGLLLRLVTFIFGSHLGLVDDPSPDTPTTLTSPAIEAGLLAAAIMAIVPAHIMRSVGGGYDNESIAMTAMTTVYYLWMRSLRGGPDNGTSALIWGVVAGVAYFNMVAAWGGYVFVINLIGVHAGMLVLVGRYSTKLHRAYSAFFVVGTALAIRVPVVGWTPLRSLEQLGPAMVFGGMQLIEFCEVLRKRRNLNRKEAWTLRIKVFGAAAVVAAVVVALLAPTGFFGPISARVRGLFVKHTKTGNPLVDSVAEHQPASSQAYFQYLHDACYVAPVGFALVALFYFHDSSSFLLVYGVAAYFFSHKMVRLILLTSPIASSLSGIALGRVIGWCLRSVTDYRPSFVDMFSSIVGGDDEDDDKAVQVLNAEPVDGGKAGKQAKKTTKKSASAKDAKKEKEGEEDVEEKAESKFSQGRSIVVQLGRVVVSYFLFSTALPYAVDFYGKCHDMAAQMSHPTILYKANTGQGQEIIVDDYREAYWWLRDNTPEDSRIMAWWDYGYQITAIANRTTIADGNTWNHEHIALLGRALTSPEKEGHRIARHLADYVLVWTGGGGDDLAKSPHLARIANSVYRHMCPGDPTCRQFGFQSQGIPSPMMAGSLLYKLHSHELSPGVKVDKNRFKHVYKSKYGKVRIYKILSVSKESKAWVSSPENRLCDAPGSWYCPGQYPPALQKVLKDKLDFAQLEDFNRKEKDDAYQKQYFENLNDPNKAAQQAQDPTGNQFIKPEKADIDELQEREAWENTPYTSMLWELINEDKTSEFKELILSNPLVAFMRSEDGRGPMFWAHEYGRKKMVKMLKRVGVSETVKDKDGLTPLDDSEIDGF